MQIRGHARTHGAREFHTAFDDARVFDLGYGRELGAKRRLETRRGDGEPAQLRICLRRLLGRRTHGFALAHLGHALGPACESKVNQDLDRAAAAGHGRIEES